MVDELWEAFHKVFATSGETESISQTADLGRLPSRAPRVYSEAK